MSGVQVGERTIHHISPASTDSTLGCGRRLGYYCDGAMEYGRHFIPARLQFAGCPIRAARGQVGLLAVAALEPLVGRAQAIEGRDSNSYPEVTSSSPGWVAQKC